MPELQHEHHLIPHVRAMLQADAVIPTAIQTTNTNKSQKREVVNNVCTAVGVKLAVALHKHSAS